MATKTKKKISKKELVDAYIKELLLQGKRPNTVYAFAADLGMTEDEFYSYYSSFNSLESDIWTGFMSETLETLNKDKSFESFGSREKLLAFFYTHLEILRRKRSYVILRAAELKKSPKSPFWIKKYKEHYNDFVSDLISDGIESKEIKERPYLTEQYSKAFWLQLMFVLDFWTNDNSEQFENTDAAIEKAVDLSFKLLGESTLDSALDLAKFIWQTRG
jgi:hypothetical protein